MNFCLKVLWKKLCFHVKNENYFHPNQHHKRFWKDFKSPWQIDMLYGSGSRNLSSNSTGREIIYILYFLSWIQARIAHLVAYRLGTGQGAASLMLTAKFSWRHHFFKVTVNIIIIFKIEWQPLVTDAKIPVIIIVRQCMVVIYLCHINIKH